MTSAPLSQQRQLLELQDLDNQLSRLAARRRNLPVLSEIETRLKSLKKTINYLKLSVLLREQTMT